jgi:hypothetical protein
MKTPRLLLSFTLSIVLCASARAELKWEQTAIELHPTTTDKQAIAHFKYENVGTQPVHFKSVRASCGCTTAQTQKDVVQPKEKGEITATFNIGDRTGIQTKTVTVETDNPDPKQATQILTLKAVIPQALEINPSFVFWQNGEEAKPKTIDVKVAKDFTVKGLKVTSSNGDFQTKVEKVKDGEFKIDVQPKATSQMLAASLTIQSEDSPKMYYANARVMPPANAPANTLSLPLSTAPATNPAGASAPKPTPTPAAKPQAQ